MSQPQVVITELDGQLGVLPPSAGKIFALVGPCSAGAFNVPSTFGKIKGGVDTFGKGPLVEAAAHYVERYGRPVALVRTNTTTVGSFGDVTSDFADVYQIATIDVGSPKPNDDYEVFVLFLTPGTVGDALTPPDIGITYQTSVDNGRTMSPIARLGDAVTITIAGTGDIIIDLTDGQDIAAGDSLSFVTHAPLWSTGELGDALTALGNSTISWEQVEIVGPMDPDAVAKADTVILGMAARGKYHNWIGSVRMPNVDETEAEYLAALSDDFADTATVYGQLWAGPDKMISSITGRKYHRPACFVGAALQGFVSEEIDIADINLGPLPSIGIRDANGNPDDHDESVNPGLDDARFTVLRTWDGFPGVYVNRPRLFSPDGSDFQLVPHRRVMNLAHGALRAYFIRRLNKPVRVSKKTGFILEEEALEIEAGATAVMRATLMAKPKASGVLFTLSRTDNLLSTKTMTGQARVVPLAYVEFVDLDLGFFNPALQLVAA